MPQFQGNPKLGKVNCAYIKYNTEHPKEILWYNAPCNHTKYYVCESLGKYITLLRPVKTDTKSIVKYTFNIFTLRV